MSLYDARMLIEAALDALRAIAEETRLRIVAVLRHGELTVTDLTEILGQSQPRVSRHLRLLVDAGLVAKHREGTWVFFCLVDTGAHFALAQRRARHASIRPTPCSPPTSIGSTSCAAAEPTRPASTSNGSLRSGTRNGRCTPPQPPSKRRILDVVGDRPLGRVLDIGTGTGRMLALLADRADRSVGLDASHSMLAVARANLERLGVQGWELRQGDVHSPPFERASFDLVVIHQVLHYLDDPARALAEAGRLVAPGGPSARRRLRPAPPRLPPGCRAPAPRFHPRSSSATGSTRRDSTARPSSTSNPPPATTDSPSPSGSHATAAPSTNRTTKHIASPRRSHDEGSHLT